MAARGRVVGWSGGGILVAACCSQSAARSCSELLGAGEGSYSRLRRCGSGLEELEELAAAPVQEEHWACGCVCVGGGGHLRGAAGRGSAGSVAAERVH